MFVRVELVRPFQPRRDNAVYGMDRLIDMSQYPKAQSVTMYAIADSEVDGSPMTIRPVGNDVPDPGGGVVFIGELEPLHDTTTPGTYSKRVHTVEIAKAAFPFYGLVFITGPTGPTKGFCWAYADVWWEGA